jgi:hypothetical protein
MIDSDEGREPGEALARLMRRSHHVLKGAPGPTLVSVLSGNANPHLPRHAALVRAIFIRMDPQKCDFADAVLQFLEGNVDQQRAPIPFSGVFCSTYSDHGPISRGHLI